MLRVFLLISLTAVLLASCGTTRLVNEWHEIDYTGEPVSSFFVLAVTDKVSERRFYESAMVDSLRRAGLSATASFRVLEETELTNDVKMIERAIAESNAEVILTTRVIDVTKQKNYVPPAYIYVRHDYRYPHFHDYFHPSFHVMMQPGYESTDTIITLETNIYSAADGKLIWTGNSRSFNPASVKHIVKELAELMIVRLREHRFIR